MRTTPTLISALPAAPDRADRATFSGRAVAMFTALKEVFVGEVNAIASNVNTNAGEAATSAANAAAAEFNANIAAANAASSAGAAMWVSGTSYTLGAAVWSLSNKLIYRRIVAGAGATDPSADATNWALVGVIPQPAAPAGSNVFLATNFGAL